MTHTPPAAIDVHAEIERSRFVDAVTLVVESLHAAEGPTIDRWAIPASDRLRKKGLTERLIELETESEAAESSCNLEFAEGGASVKQPWDSDVWLLRLSRPTFELDRASREGVLKDHLAFVRALLASDGACRLWSDWSGSGASCLPVVPIARDRSQIVVTSEEAVANTYDEPNVFWSAWDEVEPFGDLRLATRALDITTGVELLERVLDDQWAMARAAKPGLTEYALPEPLPEERDIYRAGERRMQMVGYDKVDKLIELTCVLEPDEHINGWEIFDLWHPLVTGELGKRKVEQARVVFLDRDSAEREKRPLLDIGARVFFQGDDGEDVEVE